MAVTVTAFPRETAIVTMTAADEIVAIAAHEAAPQMEAPLAATQVATGVDAEAPAVMAIAAKIVATAMGTIIEVVGAEGALALAPHTDSIVVTTVIIEIDVIALTVIPRTKGELETSAAPTASVTMLQPSSPRMSVIVALFLCSSLRLAFELANLRSSLKKSAQSTKLRL